jgi:hypothetical protein
MYKYTLPDLQRKNHALLLVRLKLMKATLEPGEFEEKEAAEHSEKPRYSA